MTQPAILTSGLIILVLGLGLYTWTSRGGQESHFHTTNLVAWLLIALFPVIVLFSFFPESKFSTDLAGASATGAIGAFVFIWWYGTRSGLSAREADQRNVTLTERAKQLDAREQDIDRKTSRPQVLQETSEHLYKVKGTTKRIGLLTGNLSRITTVDVWVNSENTNMQMASFFDRSVSGLIRYLGAKRDSRGVVVEDVVQQSLIAELGGTVYVPPGTVFMTTAGELQRTNGVKQLVHVASVQGQAGVGYKPIEDISCCVLNVLQALESQDRHAPLRTIVFPLMGTGQGREEVERTIESLYKAAASYFARNAEGDMETVYFLNYTDVELAACKSVLDNSPLLTQVRR